MTDKDSKTRISENLDASVRSDNVLIGMAIKRRWPVSDRMKEIAMTATEALIESDADGRVVNGAVRNMLSAEAQNQSDDHQTAKDRRLDDGKPTEIVYDVRIPGPIDLGEDADGPD